MNQLVCRGDYYPPEEGAQIGDGPRGPELIPTPESETPAPVPAESTSPVVPHQSGLPC